MSNQRILEAWRELLPEGVEISAGPLLTDVPALTPREANSVGAMDDRRRVEFMTGRAYAKRALLKLGFAPVELCVGANRAPLWPSGVSGSITHTAEPAGGHVAVAVTKTSDFRHIGIDAESNRAVHPGTWRQFLSESELRCMLHLPVKMRASVVLAIWCVKEAVSKALAEPINPINIIVCHRENLSETKNVWRAMIQRCRSSSAALEVRTIRLPELVLAAAVARHNAVTNITLR